MGDELTDEYDCNWCLDKGFTDSKCNACGRKPSVTSSASDFLTEAAATLAKRGEDYDQPGGERSMARITAAYNAVKGSNVMSETDGWLFMVLLKMVRGETAPGFHRDSYVDGSAYYGLMSESAAKGAK